jgi:5-formyltetrahydrofolate cyclo-ligase
VFGVAEEKKRLRAVYQAKRAALDAGWVAEASRVISDQVVDLELLEGMRCVGAFWPMGYEVDLRPALASLEARGVTIGLPVVVGARRPLSFRRWTPDTPMERAVFDVMIPTEAAAVCVPDALLVPLLAFDRRGHRLGYGAGYYDRTLEAMRAVGSVLTVGIAYAMQEYTEIPVDGGDQPLDWVLTEQGLLRISDETASYRTDGSA